MIIYFSGTGNSLSVARALSEGTGDTLVPVSKAEEMRSEIFRDTVIGIVCPVYFFDIPDIFRFFLQTAHFSEEAYVYAVVTCGGTAGRALYTIDQLLGQQGLSLSYGSNLTLPANSTKAFRSGASYKLNSLQKQAAWQEQIIVDVRKKQIDRYALKDSLLGQIFSIGFLKRWGTGLFRVSVDDRYCEKCGLCLQICPVNAITMDDTGVAINDSCMHCLACVHWCPCQAVRLRGHRLDKDGQYHHPDITVTDMILHS